MPLGTKDLLAVLSSFAEEFLNKTEIEQSDWPTNASEILNSPLEKRKFGFNLSLQVIFAAYVEMLEGANFEAPTPIKQVWAVAIIVERLWSPFEAEVAEKKLNGAARCSVFG